MLFQKADPQGSLLVTDENYVYADGEVHTNTARNLFSSLCTSLSWRPGSIFFLYYKTRPGVLPSNLDFDRKAEEAIKSADTDTGNGLG